MSRSNACRITLLCAALALEGCTEETDRGTLTLEQGTVVETTFEFDVQVVSTGPEDHSTDQSTTSVCDATSDTPDVVEVASTDTGWLVWGTREGAGVLRLTTCDGEIGFIDVTVRRAASG
jgi:hypothetical protein